MVKGGMLKNETILSTLAFKEGQVVMVMGTVGEGLVAAREATKFLEDMSEAEVSKGISVI
jgi:ubiquitin carboxyl-terminal hydrolase 14